ncbi:MAG TPA: ComEC/Rec2 family competence protein, partial [Alphaproteobacteria bacterium]|nr:ComEC/Rec2 family competence protein [Alphaproteobacteria bacterium]
MSGAGLLGAGRWTAAGRLAAGLGAWAGAERGRFALWLPVWLGAGIALYFALPVEPAAWIGSAALAAAALLLIPLRGAASGLLLALPLAALALGFTAAQLRTALVAAPVLAEPLRGAVVGGRVAAVERLPEGGRLLLTEVTVAGLEPGAMPARLRIRLTAKAPLPPVGSTVRLRADLQPPAPPAAPGAFDYARQAYFDRLGGTGFAFGAPEVVARAPEGWGFSFESLRETIAARIDGALSGPSAPLAAALLTGERAAIPAKVLDDMRDAGLAHLLAISGMNIGIVAGL